MHFLWFVFVKISLFCKYTPANTYTKIVTFFKYQWNRYAKKYVSLQAKTLVQNLKRLIFPVPKGDDPLDIY